MIKGTLLLGRRACSASRTRRLRSRFGGFMLSSPPRAAMSSAPSSGKVGEKEKAPEPTVIPGVALSAATSAVGFTSAAALSSALSIPVSGIPMSILLGIAIKNNNFGIEVPSAAGKGITYSTKTILQGGIVCVAAKLSFMELLTTGSVGIPVVVGSVGAGLAFIPWAGAMAGLPRKVRGNESAPFASRL